jgi:hypothetical protein
MRGGGFDRSLVQDHAMRKAHDSEDEMQSFDLAGSSILFATGTKPFLDVKYGILAENADGRGLRRDSAFGMASGVIETPGQSP